MYFDYRRVKSIGASLASEGGGLLCEALEKKNPVSNTTKPQVNPNCQNPKIWYVL